MTNQDGILRYFLKYVLKKVSKLLGFFIPTAQRPRLQRHHRRQSPTRNWITAQGTTYTVLTRRPFFARKFALVARKIQYAGFRNGDSSTAEQHASRSGLVAKKSSLLPRFFRHEFVGAPFMSIRASVFCLHARFIVDLIPSGPGLLDIFRAC